jgi:hypothetical protein
MSDLFTEVTAEEEAAIASNTRQRGVAGQVLRSFLKADMPSAKLNIGEGSPYSGRTAKSVKTALDNARKHADQADIKDSVSVVVVSDDENGTADVFLRRIA